MRLPPEAVALALILAAAGGSGVAVAVFGSTPRQSAVLPTLAPPTPSRSPTPVPAVVLGPLDGLPTPRQMALRRPVAVIVDNYYPDARPQSGLSRASLVFEAPVESGITRLMPVFLEHDAGSVGPIRSARPYFVRWAAGLGALLAHAGGSPSAQALIRRTRAVGNVDADGPQPEFYREQTRVAPHDLFSSTRGILAVARRAGEATVRAHYWFIPHKTRAPLAARGPGRTAAVDFSTPSIQSPSTYRVTYRFNRATDLYARFVGGSPALDADNGRPLSVANVVVITTDIAPIPNDPLLRVYIRAVGSGQATVIQDGRVVHALWRKPAAGAMLRIVDRHGKPIRLDPGSTWVEVTPHGALRFGK